MKIYAFFITICYFIERSACINHEVQAIVNEIDRGLEKLISTNKTPQLLIDAAKKISETEDGKAGAEIFCKTCEKIFDHVITYRKTGASRQSMTILFSNLCKIFTDWGDVACEGYTDIEIGTALFILDNKSNLTPERICSIQFQNKGCIDPHPENWTIPIPDEQEVKKTVIVHSEDDSYQILHLTDFHFDPLYEPGTNADCGLPLCCQATNGVPIDPSKAAGYWADYHSCDMPWHSVLQLMKEVQTKHDGFKYVYYTGDIISHKSWSTSETNNTDSISNLLQLFRDTFKDVPVYPILGNHEPHPTDFYAPTDVVIKEISTKWIFDLVANEWSKWLPEETKNTILAGGYYSLLVRPGFRIIALNSNVCYTSNIWLIYDDKDPFDQLKWLVNELYKAEKNGEKVHILSHIPPGEPQCLSQWSRNYAKIVNRFAKTIVAQFNGHTHKDELRVFYNNSKSDQVINVAFNGGSFTTYVGVNPNFRIYEVDSKSHRVTNYDQYIFNVTEANLKGKKDPDWYKLYSFKEAYGMKALELEDFEDLLNRMKANNTLVKQYYKYLVKDSDGVNKKCDKQCIIDTLCSITSVESENSIQCDQFKQSFNKLVQQRHFIKVH